MFLLSKLLPLFVLPLGVSLILLIWGLARRRRALILAGVLVLLISSNPFVGRSLIRAAEQWADRRSATEAGHADAIVVLSAGRILAPGPARVSEWDDANRFFGGLELFQAGRAPLMVFTAAWNSWEPDAPPEGAVLAEYARALGVPAERTAVTPNVSNTADEALETARLLRERGLTAPRVLLVTSAFHMPRARRQFEAEGLSVEPFPVDFWLSQNSSVKLLDFLPSVGALSQTQTACREFYGRAYYWLRHQL